jgi:butyryl-CoA dehydrogenase
MEETVSDALGITRIGGYAAELENHLTETVRLTRKLASELGADPRRALANATVYLDMFGHLVVAWMWLRQALVAARRLEVGQGDPDHLNGKLAACRYFFTYELPKTRAQRELLGRLDETTLDMRPEWF